MKRTKGVYLIVFILIAAFVLHTAAFADPPEEPVDNVVTGEQTPVDTTPTEPAPTEQPPAEQAPAEQAPAEPAPTEPAPVVTPEPAAPVTDTTPAATPASTPAATPASTPTPAPAADPAPAAPASAAPAADVAEEPVTDDVWQYDYYPDYYYGYYGSYGSYSSYDAFDSTADILEEEEVVREDSEYNEFADKVLAAIIEEGMTDEEKCKAIYDYVHEIPYVNVVYSKNWKENGYRMLHDREGDCFGFYAASRLLLERLGYQVIELQNINGFKHVWCLVSIDKGKTWLHFDPTCWSWGSDTDLCLLTDDELVAYGTEHQVGTNQLSHDWDRELAEAEIEACRDKLRATVYMLTPPEDSAQSVSAE